MKQLEVRYVVRTDPREGSGDSSCVLKFIGPIIQTLSRSEK